MDRPAVVLTRQEHAQLLPGLAAIIVAIALAYYMFDSPLVPRQLSTVVIAAVVVGVAVLATAAIAVGRDEVALAIGLLLFPVGFVGFALAPQLWIVGLLLVLPTTLEQAYAPYALLLLVGILLALTATTASGYQVAAAGLAVVVFAVAGFSVVAARSEPQRA